MLWSRWRMRGYGRLEELGHCEEKDGLCQQEDDCSEEYPVGRMATVRRMGDFVHRKMVRFKWNVAIFLWN